CDRFDEVGRLLAELTPSELASEDDLRTLREAHARLRAEPVPDGPPLHGDAHFRNVLWSPDGPLWSDLENACRGPVEYDLAALVWRDAPGTREALDAYGPYNAGLVERLVPFVSVFLAAWTIRVVERDPAPGHVAELRRRLDWVRAWLATG
ncbi:MAG: aminoglycoside phosphotransferase family protein, partial [Actinomycetota bacterium]|nr:aminoglycoside phosphotransferase family protein [Actinomycetota bacterium]